MSPAYEEKTLDHTQRQSLSPNNKRVLAVGVYKLYIPNKLPQTVTLAQFKSEWGH
jgi:hypothetical protein